MKEVLKGVDPTAGTITAGWGFHCWSQSTPAATQWLTYSAEDAASMVADGSIVTNSVFARNVPAMFDPQMSLDERHYILAFAIPAVSSAAGLVQTFTSIEERRNLMDERFRNGWGRPAINGTAPWLHSDMKDVSFFYNFKFHEKVIEKGILR